VSEAKRVLLYADVLGMKARWQRGIDDVLETYRDLERIVVNGVRRSGHVAVGGVQSDAVALTFPSVGSAVLIGRRLFQRCFNDATATNRMWLRGLIVACETHASDLITEEVVKAGASQLSTRHFSRALLDAINIEQSFKGPRLLIADSLVDAELMHSLRIPLGHRHIVPLKHLAHSPYPRSQNVFQDVLYLVPQDLDLDGRAVERVSKQVSQRMRWASSPDFGGAPQEFEQVAALSVGWMETEAIIRNVQRQAGARAAQSASADAAA
jgi:hypothetical protein